MIAEVNEVILLRAKKESQRQTFWKRLIKSINLQKDWFKKERSYK